MRRQLMNSSANPTSTPSTILAPVGGWNAQEPLANMQSKYAITMDNFFPRTSDLQLRKGTVMYANCYDTASYFRPPFLRLFSYSPANGVGNCLFAVSNEGFIKLPTIRSTEPIITIDSAATNGLWQSVNFSNEGGNWLWCCCGDGENKARVYNGTEWTILDSDSTPALDHSTDWIDVCVYKRRLWLAKRDSAVLYFLDTLAIAGIEEDETLHTLPLGGLWNKGGSILKIMNISLDSGEGLDDYIAIFSTEGQVCLYKGTDPETDEDWSLIGVYDIPRPLGTNCFMKYGGDIVIMTENGLMPFSSTLQDSMIKRSGLSSSVIHNAWLEAVEDLRRVAQENNKTLQQIGQYCSLCLYSEENMLICNFLTDYRYDEVHTRHSYSYQQFIQNTETGAWCRFKGLQMAAFTNHKDSVYCVGDRYMYKFWEGYTDNNAVITGLVKTAYVFPSGRGTNSRITLIRPTLQSQKPKIEYTLRIDSDYLERNRMAKTSPNKEVEVSRWDAAYWDEAIWQGAPRIGQEWTTVKHYPGKAISIRLKIITKGVDIALVGFDLITQSGGMI